MYESRIPKHTVRLAAMRLYYSIVQGMGWYLERGDRKGYQDAKERAAKALKLAKGTLALPTK